MRVWITQSQKIVQPQFSKRVRSNNSGAIPTCCGYFSYCQALGAVNGMMEVSRVSKERVIKEGEDHAGELFDIRDSVTSQES